MLKKSLIFFGSIPKSTRSFSPDLRRIRTMRLLKQMRHFGAMVSFDLKGGNLADATTVLSSTKLFSLAESLGGVESLIGHPASMTHASIPREERLKVGLTDSLIRLSVGIEDVDDLIEDLEMALAKVEMDTLAIA